MKELEAWKIVMILEGGESGYRAIDSWEKQSDGKAIKNLIQAIWELPRPINQE
jgi:hypothetical protein